MCDYLCAIVMDSFGFNPSNHIICCSYYISPPYSFFKRFDWFDEVYFHLSSAFKVTCGHNSI